MESAFRCIGSNTHFIVNEIGPGGWESVEGKVWNTYAIVFLPQNDQARKWVESQTTLPLGRMTEKQANKTLSIVIPIEFPVGDQWAIKASFEFYDAVEHAKGHYALAFGLLPIGATFRREDMGNSLWVKLNHTQAQQQVGEKRIVELSFGTIVRQA